MTTVNTDAGDVSWQAADPGTPSDSAGYGDAVIPPAPGTTPEAMDSSSSATPARDLSAAAIPPALSQPPGATSLNAAATRVSQDAVHAGSGAASIPLGWVLAITLSLLLVVLCGAALIALSRIGWRRFVRRYPVERPTPGTTFVATLVRFASPLRSYRDSVRVTLGERGLRFSATRKGRWSQPDFTVPWTSVAAVLRRRAPGGPRYRIVIDDAAGRVLVKIHADLSAIVHTYWKVGDASRVLAGEDRAPPLRSLLVRPLEPELRDRHIREARPRRGARPARRRTVRVGSR